MGINEKKNRTLLLRGPKFWLVYPHADRLLEVSLVRVWSVMALGVGFVSLAVSND